jgi:hypothetical protein
LDSGPGIKIGQLRDKIILAGLEKFFFIFEGKILLFVIQLLKSINHAQSAATLITGTEYHGYTSDITRTWPVKGAPFSDQQKM